MAPGTLSVADSFFFEELQAAVGRRQASEWLSSQRRACQGPGSSSSTTPSSRSSTLSPPPRRRPDEVAAAAGAPRKGGRSFSSIGAAQKPAKPQSSVDAPAAGEDESEDAERLKRVLRGGGRDAGLVFTDAAHRVCDVRT